MLITVPLMIWSARTLIDSQAWRSETSIPVPHRRQNADHESGREPERPGHRVGHRLVDDHRHHEPDECGGQHHPLDADVHDAAPLVHDPAQGAQGDRGGELEGGAGRFVVKIASGGSRGTGG